MALALGEPQAVWKWTSNSPVMASLTVIDIEPSATMPISVRNWDGFSPSEKHGSCWLAISIQMTLFVCCLPAGDAVKLPRFCHVVEGSVAYLVGVRAGDFLIEVWPQSYANRARAWVLMHCHYLSAHIYSFFLTIVIVCGTIDCMPAEFRRNYHI